MSTWTVGIVYFFLLRLHSHSRTRNRVTGQCPGQGRFRTGQSSGCPVTALWNTPLASRLLGMSDLRIQREISIPVTCTECGESLTLAVPRWSRLDDLRDPAHDCVTPAAVAHLAAAPTARVADPQLVAFVAEHLEPGQISPLGILRGAHPIFASGGTDHVELSELHDLFEEEYRRGWGSGMFSRKLREVLPPNVDIRREMINGDRSRRVIGMRWRKH